MPSSLKSAVRSSDPLDWFINLSGHTVIDAPLKENKSFSIEGADASCYIVLSNQLLGAERRTCLGHELGHCEYAGFYTEDTPYELRSRKEYRANKWAFFVLAPPDDVKKALKLGYTEPWELADWFGITEEFMKKAFSYYKMQNLI